MDFAADAVTDLLAPAPRATPQQTVRGEGAGESDLAFGDLVQAAAEEATPANPAQPPATTPAPDSKARGAKKPPPLEVDSAAVTALTLIAMRAAPAPPAPPPFVDLIASLTQEPALPSAISGDPAAPQLAGAPALAEPPQGESAYAPAVANAPTPPQSPEPQATPPGEPQPIRFDAAPPPELPSARPQTPIVDRAPSDSPDPPSPPPAVAAPPMPTPPAKEPAAPVPLAVLHILMQAAAPAAPTNPAIAHAAPGLDAAAGLKSVQRKEFPTEVPEDVKAGPAPSDEDTFKSLLKLAAATPDIGKPAAAPAGMERSEPAQQTQQSPQPPSLTIGSTQAVAQTEIATQAQAHARAAPAAAQVAQEIVRRFDGGNTSFELRLDPPELGRVEVRLDVSRDHRVTATVSADNPQALAELARHARDLEQSLQSAGLTLNDNGLSFDLRQGGERTDDGQDLQGGGAADGEGEAAGPDAAPLTARLIGFERWRAVRVDISV